jgi:hypothetical protein
MVKVINRMLRRQRAKLPRHLIGSYKPAPRVHPWFEKRAERVLELGQYR